jgi:hypothetical protein
MVLDRSLIFGGSLPISRYWFCFSRINDNGRPDPNQLREYFCW